ncbi:ArsR family transcriptional regulator [Halomicroarcula sp. F13]|uniref:ArsR family transcriptional regulator n=1 Tax=Haloarcula rubra TaxID=2487747 RepID=A0AAW4Q022_9EURY|nr:ArsR family transcriptional regulator [Halomicroarcula rubra]MBX0325843.1 ArsR family transcriptional regulator [Halomicroarcula rubra]
MTPTDQDDADVPSDTDGASGDAAWKEHTSAFDRVRSVALSLSDPRSAGWIAAEALVAENTARRHLDSLVELHVLTTDTTGSAVTYYPDPVYVRTRDLRELVTEHDRDELTKLAADLKADVESWQDEYDVRSPDELRSTAAGEETSAEEARVRRRTASDWELTEYRLSLIEDALSRYDEYSDTRTATA